MDKIQIKCPACGQKFSVTESYIGRMVECGACDEKFKVEESTIVSHRKNYPGKKYESNPELYSRYKSNIPKQSPEVSFQKASYQEVSPEYAQPPRPLKTLMICIGAIFIILFIALFLIGGREEGILKNLDNSRRLILASFVTIAGSGLIISGARHKSKGLLLSLALGGTLIAMPFIFPEVSDAKLVDRILEEESLSDSVPEEEPEPSSFEARLEKYKLSTGFAKVEKTRETLKNDLKQDPDLLKVIILHNNPEKRFQDLDPIISYLETSLTLEEAPLTYSYGREIDGVPVILITFITPKPMQEVIELTKRFGSPKEMNDITSALKVIEIEVNRNTLISPNSEFTNNVNHPEYYTANYWELRNIDRDKQLNAAKRLQSAPVKGMQADISTALRDLINMNDHELSRQAIATLYHWTRPEYKTDQRVLEYAATIVGTELMHSSVMDYLADKEIPDAVEILAKQWSSEKGNLLWENHVVRAKKRGEMAVLSVLPTLNQSHYKSAAFILSKVGTAESIPAINNLLPQVNENDQKYFKDAIDEINSRL